MSVSMAQAVELVTLTDELRRERLLDIEARLHRHRAPAFGILAVALIASGPWIGWLWLIPLLPALGAPLFTRKAMAVSPTPERWAAAGWAISPAMIAVSVALTGGPKSSAICWFAVPAVTLGARFERRGVILGLAYLLGLLLLSTVAVDPSAAAARPDFINFPVALTLAVTVFSAAIVQSDRHHRLEAVVDPLTGLLNRTALYQRFGELRQQAQMTAGGSTVGFLVVDLDHFKRINDEHGHATGDAVLERLAYVMRNSLRAFDLVYRLGGEEFVVVLPGVGLEKAAEIAERLRQAAERARPEGLEVTVSVGVAVARGKELDFDDLYARADAALYAAKDSGRNRVHAWDPVSILTGSRIAFMQGV
ncbi:MAG TPA: GGDEF domain-containing protein [Thermoleophilaceae bacterium]|nr:GGDEF domain-containing protein [Thermoleophilaceae bacterium]